MADEDYGARIRAAQAYAGLDLDSFAKAIGFSKRTLERVVNGTREVTVGEAKRIADVSRVPIAFLIEGWSVNRPIQDRLNDIERQLGDLHVLLTGARERDATSDETVPVLDAAGAQLGEKAESTNAKASGQSQTHAKASRPQTASQ